jgi:alpha-glucosidase
VPSYAFGNHDQPRIASRIGEAAARSSAVLLLTLPGMAFLYYGDEIGMKNVFIPPEMVQDPAAKGDAPTGSTHGQGRDPERTPMQWTGGRNAGFTEGDQTWLPIARDHDKVNVETELADPRSLLSLYQTLGKLRATSDTLKIGGIHVLDLHCPDVLGFVRERPKQTDAAAGNDKDYVVLINFSGKPTTCSPGVRLGRVIVSSYAGEPDGPPAADENDGSADRVKLRPHEAVVFEVV